MAVVVLALLSVCVLAGVALVLACGGLVRRCHMMVMWQTGWSARLPRDEEEDILTRIDQYVAQRRLLERELSQRGLFERGGG